MPLRVEIPMSGPPTRRVLLDQVHSVICNRIKDGEEQYLVRWKTDSLPQKPPLSWHNINELARCLEHVQDYLDARTKSPREVSALSNLSKKRKSPDSDLDVTRRPSPFEHRLNIASRTPSTERSQSRSNTPSVINDRSSSLGVYNGVLDSEDGFVYARSSSEPSVAVIDLRDVPTPEMQQTARRSKTDRAHIMIRAEYDRRLKKVPGKPIHLVNTFDSTTPSLRFRYIKDYELQEGVYKLDPTTQEGCQKCSPHMGRDIGCEYTKKCDCLEYAAVDESRLTTSKLQQEYRESRESGGSSIGLPKKFPYFAEGTKIQRVGTLVPFYLHSRRPIYECNGNCKCGPYCRNKNVQFGRTVELEIFKTASGRGWGLRCKQDLAEGQFVDTYRGEVITDAEATRREESSSKAKASYLYSLDKFQESEGLDDSEIYVVDGEFMGGPTKFMNHSCEPNCRQYTVSYNKHDCRVYDIAFFACRDIPAGEELTFDYLDKEEGDDDEVQEVSPDAIPCLCGTAKCRRWLWT
ncbi:hypothetical protein BDV96DRAFT_609812 [Lophiotrema nucula]|uniref:SET domain-containing protein n=1 Tax=Lophiotrema nucula TaxID=690887 RepID=A0A6A5ZMN5_9PLEO|nr:hypothetical protein BDV96DRAFT_609812 [Lophiotrema nucula]